MMGLLMGAASGLSGAPREPDWTLIYPHGSLTRIEVRDGHLTTYAGWTRGYGIMTFDVTDPARPRLEGGLPLPGYVNPPTRLGDHVYIPSYFGLFVLDESGDRPVLERNLLLGFSTRTAPGRAAVAAGDRLLVTGNASSRLFDISVPSAPLLLQGDFGEKLKNCFAFNGSFYTWGGRVVSRLLEQGMPSGVATAAAPIAAVMAAGTLERPALLMLDRQGTLTLMAPDKEARLEARDSLAEVEDIRMTGGGVFLVGKEQLRLLEDVSRGKLTVAREFARPAGIAPQFDYDGRRFYTQAVGYNRSIAIHDAASPTLAVTATIPVARSDGGLAVTETAVYLGSGNQLRVYDRSAAGAVAQPAAEIDLSPDSAADPQNTVKSFGAYNLLSPFGIHRFGDYLLFAGTLVDIRKPLEPVMGEVVTDPHLGASTNGGRVALAQGGKITIADVSALPAFKTLGTYVCATNEGPMLDVALHGKRLYAIDTRGFYVFDATNPASIRQIAFHAVERPCALVLACGLLYVPTGVTAARHELAIYNPEDGSIVRREGLIHDGVSALAAEGSRLFMADGTTIRQLDLTNPGAPAEVKTYTALRSGETADQRTDFTRLQIVGERLFARKYSRMTAWETGGE